MRDFIRFLNANKLTLLFLLLQIVSFSLLFRFGVFQRVAWLSSVNSVTAGVQSYTSSWTDYFHLNEVNEQLRKENVELIQNCELSLKEAGKNYVFAEPEGYYQRRYQFQYAHVLSSTKHLQNNFLTIDVGRAQGIEKNMGVIAEMSLVGRIDKVTEQYALVVPIIHREFEASALLDRTGHFGLLSWDGLDYRYASLAQIPKEAQVRPGDRVSTRGGGSLFPPGILIGEVQEAQIPEGANFYEIKVALAIDFSRLQDVMCIKDMHHQQMDSLVVDIPMEP